MPGPKRTISTPKEVPAALRKVREVAFSNPDRFIQTQLQVVTDLAEVVPFAYNWSQRRLAAIIREEEKLGKALRLWILKSRQIGSSTMIGARFFAKIWAKDNLEALILSQREDRSEELLARVKFFIAKLAPELYIPLALDSKTGLQFADTRSKLSIVSARNKDAAKGGTKQLVTLSEFSVYQRPLAILKEFLQPIADKPGTEVFIETTGANFGGDAHDHWKRSKKGKTNFRAVFLPWQEDPGCNMRFDSERQRDLVLSMIFDYEPRLEERMKLHKLTAGQIAYAYKILRNKCDGDYEIFLQYYPCTDEEAWRSKGESYFGTEYVNRLRRIAIEFPFEYRKFGARCPVGEMFSDLSVLDRVDKITDENDDEPFFKIWKRPHPRGEYIISGDSAEGLTDGNFSSSFVIDMNNFEMIAEFHGKVRPDEHARIMASLSECYNNAIIANEINPPGNVALFELQRMEQTPNLWRWKVLDNYKPTQTIKVGWQTNSATRPTMLQLAKRLVEDICKGKIRMPGIIKSYALVDEMATFSSDNPQGKPEAINGANDDRVMAWAIAIIVASWETYGTERDILSLYQTSDGAKKADLIEISHSDPKDVMQKFNGAKHAGLLVDEHGNRYGDWNLRY